ncbi:Josephin-2-like [Achlya hypogyna]|uniref:ubiquitinyl hydrolase 1 n=1 Tax=Achlya hypogyna TaxID=1202772 RepID=A0A1V9ZI29_ACHHY|nr:Josephin-2-like [Achlya hypogyna]
MADDRPFHERQQYMRCGLHAANNLLQRRVFSSADLDAVAADISPGSWRNPLGNYDVQVLSVALQRQGFEVSYFDVRRPMEALPLETSVGLVCNVPQSSLLGLWQSRHWFTIRKVHDTYYNLDSKLATALPFNDAAAVRTYLAKSLAEQPTTTILVVTQAS